VEIGPVQRAGLANLRVPLAHAIMQLDARRARQTDFRRILRALKGPICYSGAVHLRGA
jgi:hypothetical protein